MGRLLAACGVIALVLVAVQQGARFAVRSAVVPRGRNPLLAIVETAFLPGAASLHVIRAAQRYYVVGRSGAHIAALCEIPAADVAPSDTPCGWLSGAPVGALRDAVARLRTPLG